ncbi:MAG: TetR family transcriptional regulator [Anaerostipes sp.]|jgi:AcrR family transcriptional regulator|nr:TetR family transcriptional regulator [Anaerostipes sp.]
MNRTNGKIAEKSKEKFIAALLSLMKTFTYRDITITQIAQEAMLSRRTFYRLFETKDSILEQYLLQLFGQLAAMYQQNGKKDYWDAAPLFFSFWKSQEQFLMLLKDNHMLYTLLEHQDEYYKVLLLSKDNSHPVIVNNPHLPYMTAYSMGGLINTLIQWVENDMKDEPSDFLTYIHSIYKNA